MLNVEKGGEPKKEKKKKKIRLFIIISQLKVEITYLNSLKTLEKFRKILKNYLIIVLSIN